MASAIYPLRLFQYGFETVKGTAVPATYKIVGIATYTPEIDREFEEFPRGVRAPVTGGGFTLRKGSMLNFEGNLTYEEVLLFLESGLKAGVLTGAGPYTYTYTPTINANAATSMKTATIEFVIDDGSTKHFQREAAFAVTRSFTIDLAFNQPAKITAEMFARAEQTSTVTAGLTPITGRTQIPSNLFKVFIDASGGTIGTTQKSTLIRSATLNVTTGFEPDYTLDGLADLDFTQVDSQMLNATLDLTMEHNADAATEIGIWRSGSVRLIRLKVDNGAAAGANKAITFDGAYKYLEPPAFSEENGIEIVTMKLGLEYDQTWAKAFEVIVINGLAALP